MLAVRQDACAAQAPHPAGPPVETSNSPQRQ